MISRFQGPDGKVRLITALRSQQIVQGEEAVAVLLADAAHLIQIEPGAPNSEVIRQGATDNDIQLILNGSVSIRVNGREVARRTVGQHIGEMALIDPTARRSASVVALEQTVLATIPEPVFSSIAQAHPQLWRRLAVELGTRLRERGRHLRWPNERPFLFIGSSVESLPVARELQSSLAYDHVLVTVWTDGVFRASRTAVESLLATVAKSDFALLVLSADDTVISRDEEKAAPRDNCIFELGLFMGVLGCDRNFIVKPRGLDIKLPSDLLGITPLEYALGTPETLAPRIAPLSTAIRKVVNQFGSK
jgi:predicted nucleotide-binding protein